MTVTTSARMNAADIQQALPPGGGFASEGADLTAGKPKTLRAINCTDDDLHAAITSATAIFVDYTGIEKNALGRLSTLVSNLGVDLAQGAADLAQLQRDMAAYAAEPSADPAILRTMQATARLIANVTVLAEGTHYLLLRLGIVLASDTGPRS